MKKLFTMVDFIIVLSAALFIYMGYKAFFGSESKSDTASEVVKYYRELYSDKFPRRRQTILLKGTGDYYNNGSSYRKCKVGQRVYVRWDKHNEYDDYALGTYDPTGSLIGYIPAERDEDMNGLLAGAWDHFAKVIDKYEDNQRIKIMIWYGYEAEELNEIINQELN